MKIYFCLIGLLFFSSFSFANQTHQVQILKFSKDVSTVDAERQIEQAGFEIQYTHKKSGIYTVISKSPQDGLQLLSKAGGLLFIEPSFEITIEALPNDPRFDSQKGLKSLAPEYAWSSNTGSSRVTIAVIDTGIAVNHKDLQSNIWRNPQEIPNNQRDDDNNGYVDDIHGWDFAHNDNDASDDHSHGSHVAGIISATGNNGVGISGVSWHSKLMALKFLKSNGSGSSEDAIKAILYAVDNGAQIINASWGSTEKSEALKEAIEYARDNDVLFVAAAGNADTNNDNTPHYPSSYNLENVLSVGAVHSSSHSRASFSNYGKRSVHLYAPGVNIYSTIKKDDNYERMSGTSMAAPMVSGLAALLLSEYPQLTLAQFRNGLLNSTIEKSNLSSTTQGYVTAEKLFQQVTAPMKVWPARHTLTVGDQHQFTANQPNPHHWSVSDTSIATIDQKGLLTAVAPGDVQVLATLGSTQISNEWLRVLEPPGSGGCNRTETSEHNEAAGGSAFFFILPLFLIGLLRRRRNF